MRILPKKKFISKCKRLVIILLVAGFGTGLVGLARTGLVNGPQLRKIAESQQIYDQKKFAKKGNVYDRNMVEMAKTVSGWAIELVNTESLRKKLLSDISQVYKIDIDELNKLYVKTEDGALTIAKSDLDFLLEKALDKNVRIDLLDLLAQSLGLEADDYYEDILRARGRVAIKDRVNKTEEKIAREIKEFETQEARVLKKSDKIKNYIYTALKKDNKIKKNYRIVQPYKNYIFIGMKNYRDFPLGNMASKVMGFETEDKKSVGYGVEGNLKELLQGTPGKVVTFTNTQAEAIPGAPSIRVDPEENHLILTIDLEIQRFLEEELKKVYENSQGYKAMGIIMEPKTGAVLAMASIPDFDPSDRNRVSYEEVSQRHATIGEAHQEQWQNPLALWRYEPGSVFKPFVAAAALEEKLWSEGETYTCTGRIQVADKSMACHRRQGHGTQTLEQALVNSCNPFFISVGLRLGRDVFQKYLEAFGFTEKTGFELAEYNSILHKFDEMTRVNLASSSFGQSFNVTPLQLITAISAIANEGGLMQPYIVERRIDSLGNNIEKTQPHLRRQAISKTTADKLVDMMEDVVVRGSGEKAYVPGYRVAGKTGTSEKLEEKANKIKNPYVASFAGFAPADDPKVSILIVVDKPVGIIGGGQLAAPVAGRVLEKTLKYLNVEPIYNSKELETFNMRAPGLLGLDIQQVAKALENTDIKYKIFGQGTHILKQYPAQGAAIAKKGVIALFTQTDAETELVKVPDFTGLDIDRAYKLAADLGLNLKAKGNISISKALFAEAQNIEVGKEVAYGSEISVNFDSNTITAELGG
ncbi:MAG: hypothetical protein GX345_00085 [Clostridiales bacterium]|nr:hypothetical protein [Clostridiales bacterium]